MNDREDDAEARVREVIDGLGADTVIEAVGVPESVELCTRLVRAGGVVANVGVHGMPAVLHLEDLWIRGVTITMGLVDTFDADAARADPRGTARCRTVRHAPVRDERAPGRLRHVLAGGTGALKVVVSRS